MIEDQNKGIKSISYNHLNLPTFINLGAKGTISYLYNASGIKLRKVVTEINTDAGNTSTITDYTSGFQYKNQILQYFPTSEGYVNFVLDPQYSDKGKYSYVYNYTDHLGNIRLRYAINPSTNAITIVEENHYYPFGLKHANYNINVKHFEFELDIYIN